MIAALLLLASIPLASTAGATAADTNNNLVVNPGFEAPNLSPWVITGTTSAVSIQAKDNHTPDGSHSAAYWSASDFQFTVSQTLVGLADGRYSLSAWSQGGGGEKVSKLFAKDYGGTQLNADFHNNGYNQWNNPQLTHININVTNGQCTIGFYVEGNAGNWGSFDDIVFTRIGDIEGTPSPLFMEPVNVSALVHMAPELPSVVKAVYMDDHSYAAVPVTWEPVNEAKYAQTGTFQVNGMVQGSEIPAVAKVAITLKSADLNGDQQINVADLALAVYYLQATSASADWDNAKAADLNNDGIVNQSDLQLITEKLLQGSI